MLFDPDWNPAVDKVSPLALHVIPHFSDVSH